MPMPGSGMWPWWSRYRSRVAFAESNYDALVGSDALVIVTDWNEYRHPDFERIKQTLRRPILIDGRNLYDPQKMVELGFRYDSVGRPVNRTVVRPAATLVA